MMPGEDRCWALKGKSRSIGKRGLLGPKKVSPKGALKKKWYAQVALTI